MAHQRCFGPGDRAALLTAIEQCRSACVRAVRTAPVCGDVAEVTTKLMAAIDDCAEVLTGDRKHFWLKVRTSKEP